MANPWDGRWSRTGRRFSGGQGESFVAAEKGGSGRQAFVKTLRRVTNARARGRFKREVVAYETLTGLGLPRLLDHNVESCDDGRTPMYMAVEFIDGQDLKAHIDAARRVEIAAALSCVREVGTVLTRCHQSGVVHRDIKPANIVLRGDNVASPVLVDFGLSFNNAAEDDLTRVGEQVGNRFLRLPEHSLGAGRSAVSDVTQLAGIFLCIITGHEPRVLRDEFGQMPHQRPNIRSALNDVLDRRQLLRLMTVFDRAFAYESSARYQTASDLVTELEKAVRSDLEDDDNLQELIGRVDEIAVSRVLSASLREQRELLQEFVINGLGNIYKGLASPRRLEVRNSDTKVEVNANEQWQETCLSITVPGEQPRVWTTYRVDRRGGEYIVRIDAVPVWRGNAIDDELIAVVQRAAARQFLEAYGKES
ncbi:serine/threonine protein kinase [Mycobacterium marinum]|uniref:serine/threonine protein kinase n=1 Tax=Mycobacterium marinum TaxID=1781 RepID=UPI000358B721|nr:protein kinase [Mycobacterium marinum]EPQ75824.1 putative serine/threonine protein kinase [Mycobacterium marinum MB2]